MHDRYNTINNSIIKNRTIVKKRKEQLRKQLAVLIITISLFSFIFSVFTFNTLAKNTNHPAMYKYYKSIEITCGDTLIEIANEYNNIDQCNNEKYINEVMEINNLQNDKITAGNYLIVPYYSEELK